MKKRLENRDMFYGANGYIFSKAEELRNNPTKAEAYLWQKLNLNKLGVRFKRQHPIKNWIADFYCHKYKLVLEIDGGYHNSGDKEEKDAGRTSEIEDLGVKVLRFNNDQVLFEVEQVIIEIKERIKQIEQDNYT